MSRSVRFLKGCQRMGMALGLCLSPMVSSCLVDQSPTAQSGELRLRVGAALSQSALAGSRSFTIDSVDVAVTEARGLSLGDTTVVPTAGSQTIDLTLALVLPGPTETATVTLRLWAEELVAYGGSESFPISASSGVVTAPTIDLDPVAPALVVTAPALNFVSNGGNPATQVVQVGNVGGNPLTWSATSAASWLRLTPPSGTAAPDDSSSLSVGIDVSGLADGTHNATLTLDATDALSAPISIPVSLRLSTTPTIQVQPTSLTFSTPERTSPSPQTFTLTNTGGGTLVWSATDNQGWLALNPSSGRLAAGQSTTVTASVSSAALPPGTHSASIRVSGAGASNSPVVVPVSLTVIAQPRWLLQVVAGGGSGVVTSSPPGIRCLINQGTASGPCSGVFVQGTVVTLTAAPAVGQRLVGWRGACSGTGPCVVTVNGATSVTAVFGPAPPQLAVTPTSLSFDTLAGVNPSPQTITVSNVGGGSLTYLAFVNQPWLAVTPNFGVLGAGQSVAVTVSVQSTSLNPGTYNGIVQVADSLQPNTPILVGVNLLLR